MGSKFLSKYGLMSSVNGRAHDFELLYPIKKSIKASQIYQDFDLNIYNGSSHSRMTSQPARNSSSIIILEPLQNPPKLIPNFKSISGQEDYEKDSKGTLKIHNESPKSQRKSQVKKQIYSPKARSPRYIGFC